MAIALYNPRFIERGNDKIPNTANIVGFVWSHARWDLKVNELKKFPDDVGEALKRIYEFLIEVTPDNLATIKKDMEDKEYKCKVCEFETNSKTAFIAHAKSHRDLPKERELMDGVEEAQPTGEYYGKTKTKTLSPENSVGIPTGGTRNSPIVDGDSVGWYGEGFTKDTLDK
jgi:hypothetical protein